ncbi:MAG TPA: sigma factor-like helix-turn-helix DNA-binding protein [Candidatus Paceibacterota bacterium]|nr:sigma factor-like helix-turn-helix DNA-binding protein [Candidatus Paceibacterota bacterium]
MKNLDNTLQEVLSKFKSKQKKVINERFGLNGDQRTLQAIGDDLGVTRERIRQIESSCIKKIRDDIKERFGDFIKEAVDSLEDCGGVCKDKEFIQKIKERNDLEESNHIDNKIRFIFLIAKKPLFQKETKEVYDFWYKNKKAKDKLFSYLKKVINFFKKTDKDKILNNKVYKEKFDEPYFKNYVSISKKFDKNVFGDFGLKEWPEIEPKVIRDKAYLVLKKKQQPLHFSKIANQIGEMGIASNPAHVQTVHNELIKDNRFVLVGRGIYGLKEHGYEGGTVKEVIEKILDNQGPLHSEEVVKLVNQKKILKENTILLNLQNKDNFKRLDDGRYHIKEA